MEQQKGRQLDQNKRIRKPSPNNSESGNKSFEANETEVKTVPLNDSNWIFLRRKENNKEQETHIQNKAGRCRTSDPNVTRFRSDWKGPGLVSLDKWRRRTTRSLSTSACSFLLTSTEMSSHVLSVHLFVSFLIWLSKRNLFIAFLIALPNQRNAFEVEWLLKMNCKSKTLSRNVVGRDFVY